MNWSSSGSRGSCRPGGRASSFAAMAVSLSSTSGGAPTCGASFHSLRGDRRQRLEVEHARHQIKQILLGKLRKKLRF